MLLLLPGVRRGVEPARRTQCKNNLKQIGLALHNYHDMYDAFPPAYTVDASGRKLHSWRTLILPFIGRQTLYESIDLSKPWNDDANAAAFDTDLHEYACPSAGLDTAQTTYMGLVGDDHFFNGSQPRTIAEITGGTANVVAVMEVPVDSAIHWMEPRDDAISFVTNMQPEYELAHSGGVQVLGADGYVRFLSQKADSEVIQEAISISRSVTAEW